MATCSNASWIKFWVIFPSASSTWMTSLYSPRTSSHVDHLREVFILCRKHDQTIGLQKCEFAVSKIEFLGHFFLISVVQPFLCHLRLSSPPSLMLWKGLGSLSLGLQLLTPPLDSAFPRAKDLFSSVLELIHPQPDAPFSLSVDAFYTQLGAVLQRLLDGSCAPLGFYSKKLSDKEKK